MGKQGVTLSLPSPSIWVMNKLIYFCTRISIRGVYVWRVENQGK